MSNYDTPERRNLLSKHQDKEQSGMELPLTKKPPALPLVLLGLFMLLAAAVLVWVAWSTLVPQGRIAMVLAVVLWALIWFCLLVLYLKKRSAYKKKNN